MALALGNTGAVVLVTAATSASVLGTVTGEQLLILKATVANTDSAGHTVTAYMVAPAGAPVTANIILEPFFVGANGNVVLPISGQTLIGGSSLYLKASTTSVMNAAIAYATL